MLSTDINSTSPSRRATASATSDFPDAVDPTMATRAGRGSEMLALGDALVVMDDFGDNETQELLGERWIETRLFCQTT